MNNMIRFWEIFTQNKEERFFKETFAGEYKEVLKRGHVGTVVDVGACMGDFDLYMYDLADRIYAIEPDPDNFKRLTENTKGLDKIKIFNLALADKNGTTYVHGKHGGSVTNDDPTDATLVECKTLATFLSDEKIDSVDILKIDIEDGEKAVFEAPDIQDAIKKFNYVIGEHGGGIDVLKSAGFTIDLTNLIWTAIR